MNDKTKIPRRNTHQKQMILETLVKLGSHVSASEIHKEIAKTSTDASRATVFRVLSDMADDGILLKINTTSGDCKYDITNYPHYHIVCRNCGKVADTPTNLFPSIHVYNSLGAHFAVMNNETLSGKKWVRRGSLILCVSIILSTMFIKQHSMFDVLMAFIMGAVMYAAVYYYDVVAAYRFQTGKRQRKRARIG